MHSTYTFKQRPPVSMGFNTPSSKSALRKGPAVPARHQALYNACHASMLAGNIDGWWLPADLAAGPMPWVVDIGGELLQIDSAELADLIGFETASKTTRKPSTALSAADKRAVAKILAHYADNVGVTGCETGIPVARADVLALIGKLTDGTPNLKAVAA